MSVRLGSATCKSESIQTFFIRSLFNCILGWTVRSWFLKWTIQGSVQIGPSVEGATEFKVFELFYLEKIERIKWRVRAEERGCHPQDGRKESHFLSDEPFWMGLKQFNSVWLLFLSCSSCCCFMYTFAAVLCFSSSSSSLGILFPFSSLVSFSWANKHNQDCCLNECRVLFSTGQKRRGNNERREGRKEESEGVGSLLEQEGEEEGMSDAGAFIHFPFFNTWWGRNFSRKANKKKEISRVK